MATSRVDLIKRMLDGQVEPPTDRGRVEEIKALLGPAGVVGFGPVPEEDLGVVRAFGAGIKEGFLLPTTIFGYEGEDVPIDETSERVANFLGEMVGLGIGFVPFVAGANVALRGIGLTARVSPEVAQFLRFSLGGTVQAAGTAEDIEDLPKAAAIGFAAGAVIDGFFLSRAIRARGTTRAVEGELTNSGTLGKEIELAPLANGKTPERIIAEVTGLADESKTLDDVLRDLARDHVETVRIPELADPTNLVRASRELMPEAQVLSRRVIGKDVHEVLIHNPIEPDARLSAQQIAQWESSGAFEGMGVLYRGTMYEATGRAVEAGKMQLRSLDGRVTFAALRSDITNFLTPTVFSKRGARSEFLRNLILNTDEIGFTIASAGARGASAVRRGAVNTSEYQTVESLAVFMRENMDLILQHEGASSLEDATRQFALARGIKGLTEVDNGVTRRVHVFDQQTVNYVREPPRVNVKVDQSVMEATEAGQTLLHSFVPGWENAVVGPLRREGIPEKEIRSFLERYTAEESRRLEQTMSKELQTLAEQSRFKFFGGCE